MIKRDANGRFVKGNYVGFGFKNGSQAWNRGEKWPVEIRKRISDTKKKQWKDKKLSKEEWRIRENARNMAERLIEIKPCCEICGSTEKLERHHLDYNQPLLVNTLCLKCHRQIHSGRYLQLHKLQ